MPSSRHTTFDDYIEPPRQSSRTSRTTSSRHGALFGEEVPRRWHIPEPPLPFTHAFDEPEPRYSSRRYNTEERVPSSSAYSRTTTDLGGGRIRVSEYRTEERVPSGHTSHHKYRSPRAESSRTYRYAEPESYRYAEPEPYRYDAPEDYSYAEADTYEYAEPEFEPRRQQATGGSSRQTYHTEERRPAADFYEVPPQHTSSRSHRAHASSSTPRTSRTPRTPRDPPSYSSSRSSRSSKPSASSSKPSRGSSKRPEPIGVKPRIDLYAVLEVSRDATGAEIKKAYRTLSLRWHPDRCSGEDKDVATEMMAEINQANEVLGDSEKRAYYDTYGMLPAAM